MSLPQTKRDISDSPAAGTVTDPLNKQEKNADVDRKLRLYAVIEAFRQGRFPDNQQVDSALAYAHDNSLIDNSKLSKDGQKLIQDIRDIISTTRQINSQKNGDELIQNFLFHTTRSDVSGHVKSATQGASGALPPDVNQNKLQDDKQQAVEHLRTIISLLVTNSEARKLLSDFAVIGRDLFAQGAIKTAELARPDQERLDRVDHSAPHNEFVTAGGRRTTDTSETPIPEARFPDPRPGHDGEFAVQQHPREDLGTGAKVIDPQGGERSGAHVQRQAYDKRDEATQKLQEGQQQGQGMARQHADQIQSEVDSTDDPDRKKEVAKGSLKDRFNGMKDNLMGRVPQEHKDAASDQYHDTKNWLADEYFPKERRDQFIYRAKKVIVECQRHDDYQVSLKWLLGAVDEYFGHAQTTASKGADHTQGHASNADPKLHQATSELRILLERFANGKSMDEMKSSLDRLVQDGKDDEGLRNWLREVNAFIRKCLLEPGFVLDDACNAQGRQLRDSGRQFYDGKYKDHFDGVFSSIGAFFGAMAEDDLNARFGRDWARLTKDLLFDSEGSLKFKPHLWKDIRSVILPQLIDRVGYVPIPRVEYVDDGMEVVLENLTLSGRNLFPNFVTLESHTFAKFSPYNAINDQGHQEFTLQFGQVQCEMRDVAFYFNKKTGMPKLKDSGLVDFVLGGNGLSAKIHLASAEKDRSSVFKVKDVTVHVDTLKWKVRDSKHDVLYKTLGPLVTGLVKKQIQKALKDAMVTGLEYVDGQLVGVRDRMEEVKNDEQDDTTKMQILKEMFQNKKEEASATKSAAKEKTGEFKVTAKRDDALLPNQGHPSGWVNRQQDLFNKASTGREWRSEAFNIVGPRKV